MIIDRWRNWRPADKRFGEFARTEPPKPPEPTGMIWSVPSIEGFEGAIPAQSQNFSFPDAAWRDYFRLWLSEDGTSRDGYGIWSVPISSTSRSGERAMAISTVRPVRERPSNG